MPLVPLGVKHDQGRGPLGPEPLERLLLLLDVNLDGQEIFGDGLDDAGIRIDLGFQPSTAPSHRRGAEVQENRLPRRFRLLQRGVHVLRPAYLAHGVLLSTPFYLSRARQNFTSMARLILFSVRTRSGAKPGTKEPAGPVLPPASVTPPGPAKYGTLAAR